MSAVLPAVLSDKLVRRITANHQQEQQADFLAQPVNLRDPKEQTAD